MSNKPWILGLAAMMMALAAAPESQSASTARVAWVYNQVQVTRGGRWVGAGNGTSIASGAYVRTGSNSRAQIHYSDGSVMRMGSRSVARVRDTGAKNVQLHKGKAYFKVSPQQKKMKVRTRTAVATVLGTEFVVEVREASSLNAQQMGVLNAQKLSYGTMQVAQNTDNLITQITTLDGLVGVSDMNGGNDIQLPPGMTTLIGENLPPAPPQNIDMEQFEQGQEDLGLDDDNDLVSGELDPNNPLARANVQNNSPGSGGGNLDTSPTTGNLEIIIK